MTIWGDPHIELQAVMLLVMVIIMLTLAGALVFQFRARRPASTAITLVMTVVMLIAIVATAITAWTYNQTRNSTEAWAKSSLAGYLLTEYNIVLDESDVPVAVTDSLLGLPTGYGIDVSGRTYKANHQDRTVVLHYEVQEHHNILFMNGVRLTPMS